MADPALLLVARVHGIAGRAGELVEAAQRVQAAARDAGALSADVLEVPRERGELVLLQGWPDEAAMRAHFAGAAHGRYVDDVAGLLARPSDVVVHSVSGTQHPVGDLSFEPRRAD
jgi:quinol monooxygenase YgiN